MAADMLTHALWLAKELGVSVFPLGDGGTEGAKRPHPGLGSWAEYQTRKATEEEIRNWWTRWPNANVGVVCGPVSDLVVVDFDNAEAEDWWEENVHLSTPLWVRTSHGKHLWFTHPNNAEGAGGRDLEPTLQDFHGLLKRLKKWKRPDGLEAPKIDLQNAGHYVVGPWSAHPDGTDYKLVKEVPMDWMDAPYPLALEDIERGMDAARKVLDLNAQTGAPVLPVQGAPFQAVGNAGALGTPSPTAQAPGGSVLATLPGGYQEVSLAGLGGNADPLAVSPAWARSALSQVCEDVRATGKGGRHDTLWAATLKMYGYAKAGLIYAPEVSHALWDAGLSCGLPEAEVSGVLSDAWKAAQPDRHRLAAQASGYGSGGCPATPTAPVPGAGTPSPTAQPPAQAPRKRIRRRKAADIAAEEVTEEYLVDGMLPRRGLGFLYGPSGAAKSFAAIDLAATLSGAGDDTRWFGQFVTQCPVTYLVLEGQDGFKKRLQAYVKARGPLPDPMDVAMDDPFDPMDAADVEALIADTPKGSLVIVDTFVAASLGADANTQKEMGPLIRVYRDIARRTEGFVLLIGHTGKDVERGLAGWQGMRNCADAMLCVSRKDKEDVRTLTSDKNKDEADGLGWKFTLEVVELGTDAKGKRISSCVIRPSDAVPARPKVKASAALPSGGNARLALKVLHGLVNEARDALMKQQAMGRKVDLPAKVVVPDEDWYSAFTSQYQSINGEADKKAVWQAFTRAKQSLVTGDWVESTEGGWAILK